MCMSEMSIERNDSERTDDSVHGPYVKIRDVYIWVGRGHSFANFKLMKKVWDQLDERSWRSARDISKAIREEAKRVAYTCKIFESYGLLESQNNVRQPTLIGWSNPRKVYRKLPIIPAKCPKCQGKDIRRIAHKFRCFTCGWEV